MTKRRWFAVCTFLIGLLWSYTMGPMLEHTVVNNRFFKDSIYYNMSEIAKEGDTGLLDRLFFDRYFKESWIWLSASYFGKPMGFTLDFQRHPSDDNDRIIFSDAVSGRIHTFSLRTLTLIENENGGELTLEMQKQFTIENAFTPESETLPMRGPSGIAVNILNPDIMYVAQPMHRRIVRINRSNQTASVNFFFFFCFLMYTNSH